MNKEGIKDQEREQKRGGGVVVIWLFDRKKR